MRAVPRGSGAFRTRLHPVTVSWNLGFSLLALGVVALVVQRNELSAGTVATLWLSALGVVALASLPPFLRWRASEFAVTERELVVRLGRRTQYAIPLAGIEDVQVERSWLGRLLGYGTVAVTADGETEAFVGVAAAEALRDAILGPAGHGGGRRTR